MHLSTAAARSELVRECEPDSITVTSCQGMRQASRAAADDKLSRVLEAIALDTARYGIICFSCGKPTVCEDTDYLFEHRPKLLNQISGPKAV